MIVKEETAYGADSPYVITRSEHFGSVV